ATTWNPGGLLRGARHITLGGRYAYVTVPAGLVIVDLDDPLKPRHVATVALDDARASSLQFRYLFVTDKTGLRVVDVTQPNKPVLLPASVALKDARKLYLARTYAYVAGGSQGLAIIDIEKPHAPGLYQVFTADGQLNDAQDVVVGTTNASLFAYVADGRNGLKVVQLTSPDSQPRFYGFSPEPKPQLVAWRRTRSPALALSKGLDRDRAVDETGGQIAVFGRIGSRPFNRQEMEKLYLKPDGQVWTVSGQGGAKDFVPLQRLSAPARKEAR
ncbi:MAG: LVIVD repeat-containing protein, partial [Burkholderiaceae bacterium]